jgi:hypothetical protein
VNFNIIPTGSLSPSPHRRRERKKRRREKERKQIIEGGKGEKKRTL